MIGQNTSEIANLAISLHLVQTTCCKTWLTPVDITNDQMENSPASFLQQLLVFGSCSFETWLRSDYSHCTRSSSHCILLKITSTVDISSLYNLRSSKYLCPTVMYMTCICNMDRCTGCTFNL